MSQHDYVINNDSGASVRADINSALQAILSTNSGTSAPTSTSAGTLWLDTTGGAPYALKIRDAGNNHWITLTSVNDPGSDSNAFLPAQINLPSSGGVYESDGSTEILTESSGAVSLKNTTIDSTVTFPAGSIIQTVTDTYNGSATQIGSTADDYLGTNLEVTITPKSTSNTLIVRGYIGNVYNHAVANRRLDFGFRYHADWTGTPTQLGPVEFPTDQSLRLSVNEVLMMPVVAETITTAPVATVMKIRPWLKNRSGDVELFNGSASLATLTVMEVQS